MILPVLKTVLAEGPGAGWTLDWLAGENAPA